jgi:hypothetical protein
MYSVSSSLRIGTNMQRKTARSSSFCQQKCMVVRKKEIGIGACQSMKGNVVVYIHHGAVLLPVLLSVLFHLLFHHGVMPAIMWVS